VSKRIELRDFYLFRPRDDYKLSFFQCLSAMGYLNRITVPSQYPIRNTRGWGWCFQEVDLAEVSISLLLSYYFPTNWLCAAREEYYVAKICSPNNMTAGAPSLAAFGDAPPKENILPTGPHLACAALFKRVKFTPFRVESSDHNQGLRHMCSSNKRGEKVITTISHL